ncbi:protein FAM107B isoform X1 [Scleropages formosus]|nr:protein FAM107B-like isoform X1 [Scleropages formosus]
MTSASSRSYTDVMTTISTTSASSGTGDVVSTTSRSMKQAYSTDGVKSQVTCSPASQNQPKSTVPSTAANPVKASRTHQELHKELLLAYKKGLVVCSRPELQLVLERRRREQAVKEEGEQGRSPLEKVLLKRQQINQEKEKQQEKAKDDPQLLEILKVRQNLRKIHSTLYKTPTS